LTDINKFAVSALRLVKNNSTIVNAADLIELISTTLTAVGGKSDDIKNKLDALFGALDAAPITNPSAASASGLALLRGIILAIQGGGTGFLPVSSSIIQGITTGGSTTTVQDMVRNFQTDSLKDKLIEIVIDGVSFFRVITASVGNVITFPATQNDVAASVVIGVAEAGQVTVVCATVGSAGNVYSIQFIAAPGDNDALSASLADDLITVYLGKTGGALDPAKNTATAIATAIDSIPEFTASMTGAGGPLGLVAETPLTGGADAIPIVAGCQYKVY
jgi:hypothetical protein